MHTLASEIEAGPASREMSDRFLLAVGWAAHETVGFPTHRPDGTFCYPSQRPNPLTNLNAIASIEAECGALPDVVTDIIRRIDVVTILEGHDFDEARGRATIECGEHREARCRCAALLRALAARTRTDRNG